MNNISRSVYFSMIILILLLFSVRCRSPFGNNNSSFAAEPEKEITRIELSNGEQRLILEKYGTEWLIDGKSETRKSAILFIIKILEDIKIKSPVSSELFAGEITAKGIVPVNVKVYEKRKLLKTFLVYKTESNQYGNIMKIRGASKPFIVYVPGFEGDIGSAFSMNELFWQPYTVFNLLPSEISSVVFENLSDTASSFSIALKNHHYVLSGLPGNLTGWDTTMVRRYLSYFVRVPFESWAFGMGEKEKQILESQNPIYRLTVSTTSDTKTVLTLWQRMKNDPVAETIDSDRLIGKTSTINEFFIMRYFDVDPLIKKRSYFFTE